MITLNLTLPDTSYPIYIGEHLLPQAELLLPHLKQKKVMIVTNTTVAPLYLETLRRGLQQHGVSVLSVTLPDGEDFKTWETLNLIFDALLANKCERGTTLIALGGGVIGDMVGFCRRQLPAGCAVHSGSHHAAVAGGLLGRRQNRHQPPAGQKHDRRVLPAQSGAGRHDAAGYAARARAIGRSGGSDQIRPAG